MSSPSQHVETSRTPVRASARTRDDAALRRLYRNRETVALLLAEDSRYLPIFERFELEIAVMEAGDPIAKARAIVAREKFLAALKN